MGGNESKECLERQAYIKTREESLVMYKRIMGEMEESLRKRAGDKQVSQYFQCKDAIEHFEEELLEEANEEARRENSFQDRY